MIKEDLLVAFGCRLSAIKSVIWTKMVMLWVIGASDVTGLWQLGLKSLLG